MSTPEVVIVGAGIAGLAAAYEVAAAGREPLVLEAEAVPGGRIRTISYGEQYAEAGAMVVTSEEPYTLSLLKAVGVDSLMRLPPHGVEMFLGGRRLSVARVDGRVQTWRDVRDLWELLLAARGAGFSTHPRILLAYRRMLKALRGQRDRLRPPYLPGQERDWDALSFAEFVDRFDPGLRDYIDVQLKVTAGESADHISLFWGLVTFDWNLTGSFYWISGGTSRLTQGLADRLGPRLRLRTKVGSIDLGARPVVHADGPNGPESFECGSVIVAVPGPVAAPLAEWPDWKTDALTTTPYAPYVAVHVRARTRFWDTSIRSGYLNCHGVVFADLVNSSLGQPGTAGILTCFATGTDAAGLIDLADAAILERTTRELDRIFPGQRQHVTSMHVVRWPLGIPYFPVDHAERLAALRRPVSSVFFAGDYTEGAGIDDAALSGRRAALEALGHLAPGVRPLSSTLRSGTPG